MSYLVLARKYRPQTFEEVVQQTHVTQTLANAIASGRVAHAILFSGPRGTGKTTIARILAKAMNCEQGPAVVPCNSCRSCHEITSGSAGDVFEIDGASNNGVEQVRELRENIKYMPSHSAFKIYIIDEVHMLSTAAFNALLKTLEEPPAHVIFLFATTEPAKIPVTILSRCQRYDLKRVDADAIREHMAGICEKEGIGISRESLDLIAREAGGSMRDALSLLDQAATGIDGDVGQDAVLEILGVVERKVVFDIAAAIIRGDAAAALDIIDEVYRYGYSISEFYGVLIEHFRHLLVTKLGRNIERLMDRPPHEIAQIRSQAEPLSVPYLHQMLDILFKEERAIKWSARPKMVLEVAVIKLLQLKPTLPIEELIEKIDALQRNLLQHPGAGGPGKRTTGGSCEGQSATVQDSTPRAAVPAGKGMSKTEKGALPATRSPAAESQADLDAIWNQLLDIITEKHPSIAPNLAHSTLVRVTDDRLEIEVNGSIFNLNRVKKKDSIQILRQITGEFFGRKMEVKVHAGQKMKNNNGRQDKEKVDRMKRDLLSHPLVADAIEIFNGKLVDVDVS